MTSQAFNAILEQFVDELSLVYPEEQSIQLFKAMLPEIVANNPQQPTDVFLQLYGDYGDALMSRDESVFVKVPSLLGVPIGNLYAAATPNTKDAMWNYVQQLHMLALASSTIPPDIMSKITSLAENVAGSIESGENVDIASILMQLPGIISPMCDGTSNPLLEN